VGATRPHSQVALLVVFALRDSETIVVLTIAHGKRSAGILGDAAPTDSPVRRYALPD
jgi:hypothetical protein